MNSMYVEFDNTGIITIYVCYFPEKNSTDDYMED